MTDEQTKQILLDRAEELLDDSTARVRDAVSSLSDERNRYKAALKHIASGGRCPNPQQCAQEALDDA